MTNLPITSSNLPSPARSAVTTPANGMPDMQTAESFGELLAQQMEETGQVDCDRTLATTDIPTDPASMPVALLHLPHEIRTPIHKDATSSTIVVDPMGDSEAASQQSTVLINATQAQTTKFDMAIADHQAVHRTGLEITSPVVLANSLSRPPPSTQDVAPSIAASAIMPNMLANNSPLVARQTIATPLGSSGWAGEFSQKISWVSMQQSQVAELHLNPPGLGPLNVVLEISDNRATALFTSPHSAVRDAVENALPKLRETLADNGITLGNTTVSDQSPRDRGMERFMSQDFSAAVRRESSGEALESESLLTAGIQIASARRHNGMVDTFA